MLRRTGLGWTAAEVQGLIGLTRGAAADKLLAFKPQGFKPSGRDYRAAHDKWLKFMLKTRFGLQEKLVFFWHDHFATGFSKVQDAKLMGLQNGLLRKNCKGNFKTLVKAINRDPAMIEFLDTTRNRKLQPNENYPRELQELFTLGVNDLAGNPNYTQEDIVQIARAFSGWSYDRTKASFDQYEHDFAEDFPERGPKTIYKTRGQFGPGGRSFAANGEGEAEIDTVVDIIFDHRDTNGKNTVARRTARRLLEYFCHGDYETPGAGEIAIIDAVVTASQFDTTWDIAALLRAIFVHDVFWQTHTTAKKSVKWPIDFVMTTLRLLGLRLNGRYLVLEGGNYTAAFDHLSNMGQTLLDPPSVFGWDWETRWLSSSTLLARYRFASDIASSRYGHGGSRLATDKLVDLGLTNPGAIVDAVADVLGVALTGSERTVLATYVGDGDPNANVDLADYDVRNAKLNGLFALVMQSPAYQVH